MTKIKYIPGDATRPQGDGEKIICHICNDIGAWGAGFVLALTKRWTLPEDYYRAMPEYILGTVNVHNVEPSLYVANMIAQHGVRANSAGIPPVRYDALSDALIRVNTIAEKLGASLHMPKIGAGLAGGNWEVISGLIEECTTVPVTVYEFE